MGAFVDPARFLSKEIEPVTFVKIAKQENSQFILLSIFAFCAILSKSEEGVRTGFLFCFSLRPKWPADPHYPQKLKGANRYEVHIYLQEDLPQ